MNPEEARKQLNLPDNLVAVNAGSWGPLCRAARKAIMRAYSLEAAYRGDDPGIMREQGSGLTRYSDAVCDAKMTLARLLGCRENEVALCDSTTTGMNIFLWGYDWKPGEQIIAGDLENPAAKVPLMLLTKRRDLELTFIDTLNLEEELQGRMSPRTKIILVSDVEFATGYRADLRRLSEIVHENDALFLVDGIQAVGNQLVNVNELGVDGYAFARHKFLCGPDGAGALYVAKNAQDRIHPTFAGVFTDQLHGTGELQPMPSAQKYEVSTRPLPVIEGGTAATRWIMDEVNLNWIISHTTRLYRQLWSSLHETPGVEVVSGQNQNSLLSFRLNGHEPSEVVKELMKYNIFTRTVEALKPPVVRLSIGFWNRESDIETISNVISRIL